jgi:anthranilate synthase component 1
LAVPTVRSFSAEFDPPALIQRFPERYPGLLETSAPGGRATGGRFDILPISSGEALTLGQGGLLSQVRASPGDDAAAAAGFLYVLEDWWRSLQTRGAGALPFSGGWLVYLGYELAAEIEPRLHLPPSRDPVVAFAIRAPAAWIRECSSGRAWLIAEPGAEGLLEQFEQHVCELPPRADGTAGEYEINEEDPALFLAAVCRSLEYIAAGDVYQANLSREWRIRSPDPAAPADVYRRLRTANPSPFAALVQHRGFAVMSSSPERLLSIRDGVVSTRPIAGTRPRGASPAMDAALIASLLANDKERAEHVMLIDLERNDLGRVCVPGTVHVDEYMSIESYAHVHHIVSNVSGRLREEASPIDVIRALFPGGTITGCPKIRCMEIIAELEGVGRGAYTGSLGYLNRDGSCDFNILIRTFTADSGAPCDALTFRAGAGIVADSVPVQELAETRAKAEGMLRALGHGA